MENTKVTVGVVGMGHVGAHVAYALGMTGTADVVKMLDVNETKLVSERQDLMDAVSFMPHRTEYVIADYADLADCDILINTAGNIAAVAGGDRTAELASAAAQVESYMPKIMAGGFSGIIINITNPCDVITALIAEAAGLPKGRVFGTGTCLDTSRLVSILAQTTGLEHHAFTAYVMGEHGNAQMIPWSLMSFGGKPLSQLVGDPRFRFDRKAVQEQTIKAGWVTYKGKSCTEYGIASAAVTLAQSVLHDEKKIFSCSVPLDGEYGERGIFAGCPAVIGAGGVEEIVEYELPEDELTAFKSCCQVIRGNIEKAHGIAK